MKDSNGNLHCDKCGAFIGTEETLGYYSYKSRKYCDKCRKSAYLDRTRERQRLFYRNRKQQIQTLKEEVNLLTKQNSVLEEIVTQLKRELEDLKRGY